MDIIDTSETEHVILATFSKGEVISSVPENNLPAWFNEKLPLLVEKIRTITDL